MRIHFSHQHAVHAPGAFLSRGQVTVNPETPARADTLLDAARDAGHELVYSRSFGLEHVRAVHDSDYLDFLESAWRDWSGLAGHAPEVIPNVHPGRNMSGRPRAIVGRAGYYQAGCACPIGPGTWEGIQVSADGVLSAANEVMGSSARSYAYALGLDASEHDPLAFLNITTEGFGRIGEAIGVMGMPTVLVQEGGYSSEHLGANLAATLAGFEAVR